MERHGYAFPDEWDDLRIELWCLANAEDTHLHLKHCMMLLWPHLYQGEIAPGVPRWREDLELMTWAWSNYRTMTVIGHASAGKCLKVNTEVLMFNGEKKKVQDIKRGDLLMGDDSTPRKVQGVCTGREEMFKIIPSKGDPWVCNRSHILSLKASYVPKKNTDFEKGDVRDVPLEEFLTYGETKRRVWKQYRVGVDFPKQKEPLLIDPYILGVWIGDGTKGELEITKPKGKVVDEWINYWSSRGLSVSEYQVKDRCKRWRAVNKERHGDYRQFIRGLATTGQKIIPQEYLLASRERRLRLLAGLIDTDGYVDKNAYAITTKWKGLADQILFLARSLGFGANLTETTGKIKSLGFEGTYWNVHISGEVQNIPTLAKKAEGKISRDPLLQEIRAESLGEGTYYGFEIDGNRRFLLGDFTVTHNTHTLAHIAYTHYLSDAANTIITLTSTHLPGLKKRLWSDIVSAHKTSVLGELMHVKTYDMTMRPMDNPKEDKYVIEGIAVDRGEEAVTRIQGNHSRDHRYVIIDEAEGTHQAIFDAASNLMTDNDFRWAMLANPENENGEFGTWCEPTRGWNSIDAEQDLYWETARGGVCVRLDGLKSANFRNPPPEGKKPYFPFLIDQNYVDRIKTSYGFESPRWWIFVRGWFPPAGSMGTIFSRNILAQAVEPIFYNYPPTPCAALDPAFEGDDECMLQFGEYGEANGSRFAFNFKEEQAVKAKVRPGGEPLDYVIAHEVMNQCDARGVKPENFIMDTTGAGRGVYAILRKEWGKVEKCDFWGKPSDRRLRAFDDMTCGDQFDRFVTELWFSCRIFMESGLIGGVTMDFKKLREQLSARRFEIKSKKESIETKKDMKKRLGYSPDHADAFVLFTELLKRKGAVTGEEKLPENEDESQWDRARAYSDVAEESFAHGFA